MSTALWIVAIVLAVAFVGSGSMKLVVPKDKLVTSGQGWAADFSPTAIRLIGIPKYWAPLALSSRPSCTLCRSSSRSRRSVWHWSW